MWLRMLVNMALWVLSIQKMIGWEVCRYLTLRYCYDAILFTHPATATISKMFIHAQYF